VAERPPAANAGGSTCTTCGRAFAADSRLVTHDQRRLASPGRSPARHAPSPNARFEPSSAGLWGQTALSGRTVDAHTGAPSAQMLDPSSSRGLVASRAYDGGRPSHGRGRRFEPAWGRSLRQQEETSSRTRKNTGNLSRGSEVAPRGTAQRFRGRSWRFLASDCWAAVAVGPQQLARSHCSEQVGGSCQAVVVWRILSNSPLAL
jgi:hypothetical protein